MKKEAGLIVTLFLLAFAFAPSRTLALPPPPPAFFPILISPTAGQVLYPGQKVRVEWKTSIPNAIRYPTWCEIVPHTNWIAFCNLKLGLAVVLDFGKNL